jgi:hypothetical protein
MMVSEIYFCIPVIAYSERFTPECGIAKAVKIDQRIDTTKERQPLRI